MARTAHHTPHHQTPYGKRLREERDMLPRHQIGCVGPWRRIDLRDLRYAEAELALAAREGRRPRPKRIRRSFDIWHYCCAYRSQGDYISVAANLVERAARARARDACRAALYDAETAVEPYRPRHQAHWDF
ncbi:hypothetical protein Slala05_51380 [Streptomyces lavendulae subsp. lavendulae]|nr:hypothetical protein Slala05_51380 [Streptomyces lavendulae subsp. lavendulae]